MNRNRHRALRLTESGCGPGSWAFLSLALAWLCVLACECKARAQRDEREQLALELAVVAAHEGALANLAETALVYQVLEALPVEEQLAFSLRFIAELQLGECAEALGVSLATAKRRIRRADRSAL